MNWSFPTTIWFGPGRLSELSTAAAETGMRRPLVVTDRGLAGFSFVEQAATLVGAVDIFSDVDANPTGENVDAGVACFRNADADGVVAVGGGSAMDVGKLIAFAQGQTLSLWDFEDIGDRWKAANPATIAPVIAIPTTAGTGSEVGRAGVVTETATHTKRIIFHPAMLPRVVIADPELTVGLPPALTAGTGMDALAHNLEALCAPGYHPMCDGIATEGMRLIFENLEVVCRDGANLEARGHLMSAASMGAVAFQKGLGAIHSLSHPVGSLCGTHHGTTNAVFMPYVLAFNRSAIEPRIERLSAVLGIAGGFDGFMSRVLSLRSAIDMPHALSELGVSPNRVPAIASMSVDDPTAASNPVAFDENDATAMLEAALSGDIEAAARAGAGRSPRA
ncbi:MAG: iron-containing alcohol dehydrogenase [Pseudomonadota bacterium]